jgi:hypothetical protein
MRTPLPLHQTEIMHDRCIRPEAYDRLYIIRLSSLQGFIQHLQKEGRRAYII